VGQHGTQFRQVTSEQGDIDVLMWPCDAGERLNSVTTYDPPDTSELAKQIADLDNIQQLPGLVPAIESRVMQRCGAHGTAIHLGQPNSAAGIA
jgi:hypothetical protein